MNKEVPAAAASAELPGAAGALSPLSVPHTGYRRDLACILLLLALNTALWAPRAYGPIELRWDAGVYYVLGTSLAEGKGYRLLNEPGEIRAVKYPPCCHWSLRPTSGSRAPPIPPFAARRCDGHGRWRA